VTLLVTGNASGSQSWFVPLIHSDSLLEQAEKENEGLGDWLTVITRKTAVEVHVHRVSKKRPTFGLHINGF